MITWKHFELNNACLLHASSVNFNGKGLLFTGEKKSGKTSLMFQFITNGAKYISNELVFVKNFPETKIMGLPQGITLGIGASVYFNGKNSPIVPSDHISSFIGKDSRELFLTESGEKVEILPKYLENIMLESTLDTIIFPEANFDLKVPRLEKISKDALAIKLLDSIIHPFKWNYKPEMPLKNYLDKIHSLISQICKNVDAYHFQWTDDHEVNHKFLIDHVL